MQSFENDNEPSDAIKRRDQAVDAMAEFDERNGESGLLFRYFRGRIQGFLTRQIMILLGSIVLYVYVSPFLGISTAIVASIFDASESLYFSRLLKRYKSGEDLLQYKSISVVTGALQTACYCFCVANGWLAGGPQMRFVVATFLAGAAVNAGMAYRYHPLAANAKTSVVMIAAIALFANDISVYGLADRQMVLDLTALLMFTWLVYILLSFIQGYQNRQSLSEGRALEASVEIADALCVMEEKDEQLRFLAAVAENASDMIAIRNKQQQVIWVNPVYEAKSGYSLNEIKAINRPGFQFGPETSDPKRSAFLDAVSVGKEGQFELHFRRKSGSSFWVESSVSPMMDKDGSHQNSLIISRDITEAREQKAALIQAKTDAEHALKAKSNFLATMSHEIRTPLNGIIGMADLLSQTKLTKTQADHVDTVSESGSALLQIINDILDFSKLDSGNMEFEKTPCDLKSVIQACYNILEPIAREKSIGFNLQFDGDWAGHVLTDPGRYRQVVLNLLGNAVKFTETGSVTVSASIAPAATGRLVHLSVRDTGIGIPAKKLDLIFETFSQVSDDRNRKFGGTGLGLPIARHMAEGLGGTISASSVEGVGSEFVFATELAHQALPKEAPAAPVGITQSPTQSLAETRILIAEDNRTNRKLIKAMLGRSGAVLDFAENGQEAYDQFVEAPPDLVLMDLSMPVKDGISATKDIRAWEASRKSDCVPIIALTANAFAEDRAACFEAGMNAFLTKPIKKGTLMEELTQQLSRPVA